MRKLVKHKVESVDQWSIMLVLWKDWYSRYAIDSHDQEERGDK